MLTASYIKWRIENSKNDKRWYYSAAHWHLVNVMVANITFYHFCCFRCVTQYTMPLARVFLNCSFFTLILISPSLLKWPRLPGYRVVTSCFPSGGCCILIVCLARNVNSSFSFTSRLRKCCQCFVQPCVWSAAFSGFRLHVVLKVLTPQYIHPVCSLQLLQCRRLAA